MNLDMINRHKSILCKFENVFKKRIKHSEKKSVHDQQRIENAIIVK